MSFVLTDPELVQTAAQDLANIRSVLGEATTAAEASTTGVAAAAADEVSTGIASLFSTYARDYQAVSAHAAAFHDQFVASLHSGAGAYLSTEAASAGQVLGQLPLGKVSGASAPATRQALGLPTLRRGLAETSGPYEQLFANTSANLQALRATIAANPAPLLRQFLANQQVYAQRIVASIESFIDNFPGSVSAAIQTFVERLAAFDPGAFLQWVINNQIGYAETIGSALSNAAHDFTVGLEALPAAFLSAFQDVLAGNIGGAVSTLGNAFVNLFFTGFSTVTSGPITNLFVTVTPTGTLGDLLPILTIPGQMAHNFASLWPEGSIAWQASENVANVIEVLSDTSIVANAGIAIRIIPPAVNLFANVDAGMPVALLIDAAGAPVNAIEALNTSVTAFSTALHAGDFGGAFNALVDAPAVVTNGFLNGESTLPLEFDAGGNPVTLELPMSGLLVPVTPYQASVTVMIGPFPYTGTATVGGTPLSGLVPALMTWVPEQLAKAIGA